MDKTREAFEKFFPDARHNRFDMRGPLDYSGKYADLWEGWCAHAEVAGALPVPTDDCRNVLAELLRLYDLRFEIAAREKAGVDCRKELNVYGAEKKAGWEAARVALGLKAL